MKTVCGVELLSAHGLVSVVGPRQEVVGASCPAIRSTLVGELPGILTSEVVELVVQDRSLEMRGGADQVPTPLGAHPAELSMLGNVPLLGVALHHCQPLYDYQKAQR